MVGSSSDKKVEGHVLFVCVENAGRSQMAEAIFNDLARSRGLKTLALSAGMQPGTRIHPSVLQAMLEIGLNLSGKSPTLLTDDLVEGAKKVITMGCMMDDRACPTVRFIEVEDWGLPDPKGKTSEEVRAIRDEIRSRVEVLLRSLTP